MTSANGLRDAATVAVEGDNADGVGVAKVLPGRSANSCSKKDKVERRAQQVAKAISSICVSSSDDSTTTPTQFEDTELYGAEFQGTEFQGTEFDGIEFQGTEFDIDIDDIEFEFDCTGPNSFSLFEEDGDGKFDVDESQRVEAEAAASSARDQSECGDDTDALGAETNPVAIATPMTAAGQKSPVKNVLEPEVGLAAKENNSRAVLSSVNTNTAGSTEAPALIKTALAAPRKRLKAPVSTWWAKQMAQESGEQAAARKQKRVSPSDRREATSIVNAV
jgi:hypothetical protein